MKSETVFIFFKEDAVIEFIFLTYSDIVNLTTQTQSLSSTATHN
jgi:hypothetical protein